MQLALKLGRGFRLICAAAMFVAASQACGAEELPATTLKALQDATVVVRVTGHERISGVGFVCEREGGQAWIATCGQLVAPHHIRKIETIEVVFACGTNQEQVLGAKVVASDPLWNLAILAVRMAQSPAPIDCGRVPTYSEGMPVFLLKCFPAATLAPITDKADATPPSPVTATPGTIAGLHRDPLGRLEALFVDFLSGADAGCPIVNQAGELLGIGMWNPTLPSTGTAIVAMRIQEMLRGKAGRVNLTRRGIRDGGVEFDAHVELLDPREHLKEVTLYAARSDDVQEPKSGSDGRFGPMAAKMTPYRLDISGESATGKLRLAAPPKEGWKLQLQIGYVRRDGQTFYTQPRAFTAHGTKGSDTIEFVDRGVANVPRPPKMSFVTAAGPVRAPEPTRRPPFANGKLSKRAAETGMLEGPLTSAGTRLKPTGNYQPLSAFPKAEMGSESVLQRTTSKANGSSRSIIELPIASSSEDAMRVAEEFSSAVWSADGKALYVVGGDQVLRRYAFDGEPRETARLRLDGVCISLALSKAGLAVPLRSGNVTWVVHPETLAVVREIPVMAKSIAAAPATAVACAIGESFQVIDLAAGQLLHSIPLRGPPFGELFRGSIHPVSMRMAPDGKALFVGTRNLTRIAIDSDRLTVVENSPLLEWQGSTQYPIGLSPDGKWIAYPAYLGNEGAEPYSIAVFNPQNLKQQALAINTGPNPCAFDADPVSGEFYASNSQLIQIFSAAGKKRLEFPAPMHTDPDGFVRNQSVKRILASPAGRRLLVWTSKLVSVVEVDAKD